MSVTKRARAAVIVALVVGGLALAVGSASAKGHHHHGRGEDGRTSSAHAEPAGDPGNEALVTDPAAQPAGVPVFGAIKEGASGAQSMVPKGGGDSGSAGGGSGGGY